MKASSTVAEAMPTRLAPTRRQAASSGGVFAISTPTPIPAATSSQIRMSDQRMTI